MALSKERKAEIVKERKRHWLSRSPSCLTYRTNQSVNRTLKEESQRRS